MKTAKPKVTDEQIMVHSRKFSMQQLKEWRRSVFGNGKVFSRHGNFKTAKLNE
jgi:hypothetical protein